jgi:hypothetical protein
MFKRTNGFNLLILLVITGLGSQISNTTIDGKERRFLIDHLKNTKAAFVQSSKGLSEAQLDFKPSPDKWSIKECMQHLALAEKGIWSLAETTLKQPANPEKRSEIKITDNDFLNGITDRSKKFKAPEMFEPRQAKWTTTKEIMDSFKDDRAALIKYVKTTTEDVRNHVADSPFGLMDAYQIMLLISAHTNRHTQQIEEVKKDPDFPK